MGDNGKTVKNLFFFVFLDKPAKRISFAPLGKTDAADGKKYHAGKPEYEIAILLITPSHARRNQGYQTHIFI